MGQKITNPKSRLFLHYYVFQKTINQYLTDWKDKSDSFRIKNGYIIDPDWIKEWKRLVDYDNIKINYLDCFNITSTKINHEQKLLFNQHLQPEIKIMKKILYIM